MKIYQIHECGGEWEDKFDFIVGSYISPKKAIAEKKRLEQEDDKFYLQVEKCSKCPLYNRSRNINDVGKYCDDYEPFEEGVHDPEEYDESELCVNYTYSSSLFDNVYYNIEEVEVIE